MNVEISKRQNPSTQSLVPQALPKKASSSDASSEEDQAGKVHFHLAENTPESSETFVFLATVSTHIFGKTRLQHTTLGSSVALHAQGDPEKFLNLLKPIREVSTRSEFFANLVATKRIFQTTPFTTQEAHRFLQDSPLCDDAGIVVKLPKSWEGKKPSRVKVKVTIGDDQKQNFVGFNNLFKFRAHIAIDGQILSEEELQGLLAQGQSLIHVRGKWVEVDREKISDFLQRWKQAEQLQNEGMSFAEAMRFLSGVRISKSVEFDDADDKSQWVDFVASKDLRSVLGSLNSPASIVEVDWILQEHLQAELRTYQSYGVQWLCLLSKLGLGGCLADDMGLGKTIQMISLFLVEKYAFTKKQEASLLVVPASLLGNWESEIRKFAPSLRFQILHPSQLSAESMSEFSKTYTDYDVVITTYSTVTRLDWLKNASWNIMVIDEAQAIKNPQAKQTLAIKALHARVYFALTGTPVENQVVDLWSIFDFSCPGLLGAFGDFKEFYKRLQSAENFSSLQRLIQPYLLRRKKTDKTIIQDLPDKTEVKTFCLLTSTQIQLYQQTIKEMADALNDKNSTDIKRKGLILSYLLKFKQICNHPSQMLGDNDYNYEQSGKFFRLKELAETIQETGEKVLIFTQFREMTDILDGFLLKIFGKKGFLLHGGTPVSARKKMVDEFQKEDSGPYFILSLKAGGVGLNLTQASHVIHFDRWWNPAVENQATDRAFRIGQKRKVVVHKFICKGTIEEKIDEMIDSKKTLAEGLIEGVDGGLKLTKLSNDEILKLVSIDVRSAELSSN